MGGGCNGDKKHYYFHLELDNGLNFGSKQIRLRDVVSVSHSVIDLTFFKMTDKISFFI